MRRILDASMLPRFRGEITISEEITQTARTDKAPQEPERQAPDHYL